MNIEQTKGVLSAIAERQIGMRHEIIGPDGGTAPVVVSIGYVSEKTRMVLHDGIVIKDAPAAIIDAITKWIDKNGEGMILIEAGNGGLIIH